MSVHILNVCAPLFDIDDDYTVNL